MTLQHHHLQGCYQVLPLSIICSLFTLTRDSPLPSQLEYFYLEPLPVRDEPTPECLGFIVSLGVDCVYPQGSGKGSQVHQLFLVLFVRKGVASEPMTGGAQRLTRTYLKNYWTDSSF